MSLDGCSKCPLLDLGTKYPAKDPRDPWRRWPEHFAAAERSYGKAMRNHKSRTRLLIEHLLGHYCKVNREKHGKCNQARIRICHHITLDAIQQAQDGGSDPGRRIAFAANALKKAVNSDETYEALKATRTSPASKNLQMPPITLGKVPAV